MVRVRRPGFTTYSFGNQLLIALQRPGASRVAGFKAWQELGRQVRKGEHGIRILARPCSSLRKDAEGEPTRHESFMRFRSVAVFDIGQTGRRRPARDCFLNSDLERGLQGPTRR